MTDTAEKRHRGVTFIDRGEHVEVVDLEPHYRHECAEKCEEAARHPTETPSSAKVGYSKGYAARFDAAFGKN